MICAPAIQSVTHLGSISINQKPWFSTFLVNLIAFDLALTEGEGLNLVVSAVLAIFAGDRNKAVLVKIQVW
ncbi:MULTISPECIES: hypothetical protein [Nitrosomonas]|uniref:Uncharacterized protein n=1 Tax=Nitrosomonas communis TaxID=44574 RepID=A0A0F7KDV1_9PROT|nr:MULTISPECIES: hypothetical protein [Nitrosomonas]AKH36949.1 hypothetical protein AAW31_02660 [Nitrosomonas communis]UVS62082.1 hypothetical protein NX761_02820 [Nitrosomonas sp. PLL12]